jgi:hypothetical protein
MAEIKPKTPVSVTPKAPATTSVAKPAVVSKPVAKKPAIKKPIAKKPVAAKPMAKPATIAKPLAKVVPKAAVAKKPVKKTEKKAKPEKVKMERDSFTMPKDEYAQIALLKARLSKMGQPAKKSELLRAGIKLLAAMSDNTLKTTLAKIPVIKTGRPNKKG